MQAYSHSDPSQNQFDLISDYLEDLTLHKRFLLEKLRRQRYGTSHLQDTVNINFKSNRPVLPSQKSMPPINHISDKSKYPGNVRINLGGKVAAAVAI